MDRTAVRSSNIRSIGYDDPTSTLEIEFHSGGVYQYLSVPRATFDKFIASPSKGKFFDQFIKDRFKTKKIR